MPDELKKVYSICEKILRKRNSLRLEITEQEAWENSTVVNLEIGSNGEPKITSMAIFSKELLDKLYDEFFDFKEQFTIRKLDQMSLYGRRIASYNRSLDEYNKTLLKGQRKKNRLNENNVRKIIMLLQYKTFDELVKEKIISRRSKYNHLSYLKKIGIEKNSFPVV